MGRGKLALEFITKDRSRRTTFEKRKKGLMKKAEEFSILCGVDTCMIIYGLDDTSSDRGPTVWPNDEVKVKHVLDRYLNEGADRRKRNAVGLPEFFIGRKKKLDGEIARARSAVWATKYPVSDDLLDGLGLDQLRPLLATLEAKLGAAKRRLVATREAAAETNAATVEHIPVEGFGYNFPTIHNNSYNIAGVASNYQFVPMRPNEIDMEFGPSVMDPGQAVNGPMLWGPVGASYFGNSEAVNGQQIGTEYYSYTNNNNNNYYPSGYNYDGLIPTHQHPSTLTVRDGSVFDYLGQGMMGNGSSAAGTMIPYHAATARQGIPEPAMFMPSGQEARFQENGNLVHDPFYSSGGGNNNQLGSF